MDYKKIGEYIHLKRKGIGLTQAELGDLLGVTSKAVSKWECGVALPDVSLFMSLSEILKIDVSELLLGEDNKNKAEYKDKKKTIGIIILSVLLIISTIANLLLGVFFVNNYDNVKMYNLVSNNKRFSLNGQFNIINGQRFISISNVKFLLDNNSYGYYISYELYYKDNLLYKSRKLDDIAIDNDNLIDFRELLESITLSIVIKEDVDLNLDFHSKQFLLLRIKFLDSQEEIRDYNVPIKLNSR